MRALSLVFLAGLVLAGSARAGDVDWRLDELEYQAREQRYDLDALRRQQALDEVDAIGRAARARDRTIIEGLGAGAQAPVAPAYAAPTVVIVAPAPESRQPAFDLARDYVPAGPSPMEKSEIMRTWPWAR